MCLWRDVAYAAMCLRRDVCLRHVADLYLSLRGFAFFIPCNALLCHCEALPNRGPRGILCTRGEKAHTNKRVSVIACDNAILKVQCATHLPEGTPHYKTHARYFCTCVEKKAHTSKRVSVIAPDNVISKAQCAPCSAILCQLVCLVDTFHGKNKPEPCQRDTFRAFLQLFGIQILICIQGPFLLPYRRKSSFHTGLFCKASLCRSFPLTPPF